MSASANPTARIARKTLAGATSRRQNSRRCSHLQWEQKSNKIVVSTSRCVHAITRSLRRGHIGGSPSSLVRSCSEDPTSGIQSRVTPPQLVARELATLQKADRGLPWKTETIPENRADTHGAQTAHTLCFRTRSSYHHVPSESKHGLSLTGTYSVRSPSPRSQRTPRGRPRERGGALRN